MEEKNYPRIIPTNDLDLQMQLTEPAWQNLHPQLQEKLMEYLGTIEAKELINNVEQIIEKKVYNRLSSLLAVYTRDTRLGNLSNFNGELEFVEYYFELSVDLLEAGYPRACVLALNKALSKLELSSSKGGFLRKLFNTFRQENIGDNSTNPQKKSLMGANKNG